MMAVGQGRGEQRLPHAKPPRDDRAAGDDPVAAPDDQLALLQRYGTADDAARLIAEGRGDELAGLGYRPPD